jgi:hypothetical protein
MNNIVGYLIGLSGVISLVLFYAYFTNSNFAKARKQEIKKDIAEFGQCCGLETGVCTFQPKIDKLNKINLQNDAAKNKGSE